MRQNLMILNQLKNHHCRSQLPRMLIKMVAWNSCLQTVLSTRESRKIIKGMASVGKPLMMDHTMKDIGKMMFVVAEAYLYNPMVANIKVSGKMIIVMVRESTLQVTKCKYMKEIMLTVLQTEREFLEKLGNTNTQAILKTC